MATVRSAPLAPGGPNASVSPRTAPLAFSWVLTPWLKGVQGQLAERYGGFHRADKADPLFQQFTGLHQTSTAVFMIGFVAALICLVCMTQFRTRAAAPRSNLV